MSVSERAPRSEPIDDPSDPRIADYRDLKDADLRLRRGLFVAESRAVVRRLLGGARFRTRSILATGPSLEALRDVLEAADPGIRLFVTRHQVIRAVSGFDFHRGCLAVGERGAEPPLDALIEAPDARLLVLLEEVANPDNVGGVFRNALAFGAAAVLLSPGCADPLYRKTIRVSAGGSLCVPFARLADWAGGLRRVREAGYTILALTPDAAALDLAELGARRALPRRVALVVGSEGQGIGAATREAADEAVRIAMAPGVDSLNLATATGIALHRLRS